MVNPLKKRLLPELDQQLIFDWKNHMKMRLV